jgi:hypothetical protein
MTKASPSGALRYTEAVAQDSFVTDDDRRHPVSHQLADYRDIPGVHTNRNCLAANMYRAVHETVHRLAA